LSASDEVNGYTASLKSGIRSRLELLHSGLMSLRAAGHPVDAIPPMGAIYLSARFDLRGIILPSGKTLSTNEDIREYLLHAAGLAMVPFQAFGAKDDTGWFRLSVGAVSPGEITSMLVRLRSALEALGATTALNHQ
jgi:aspartate aminotransferase